MEKTGKTILWIIILIIVICLVWWGMSKKSPEVSQPIKIGVMLPLSGDVASYGLLVQKSLELAKKDLGMDNVELIYEDSLCEGTAAATAINKLISIDGVQAVVGELCSGATLAAAPIAERNKVVLISPSSTSPDLTEAGDYIFRTIPSDTLQGAFGAKLVYDKGYRKLAVLYGNEEYGLGFNNVLKESFGALGGEVVISETFERGTVDMRTQLTKIKSAEPEVIYIISNSLNSTVAALKQIKELGLEVVLIGSEGLKSEDVVSGAGETAEGLIVTSVSVGTTGFIEKHRLEYNEDPGAFGAQVYDILKALDLAFEQGAKTGTEIKDKLYEIEFDGASGHIKFDANGDILGNYDVYVVENGEYKLANE